MLTNETIKGISGLENAYKGNVPALEQRANIDKSLATGLVLEKAREIIEASANDLASKVNIQDNDPTVIDQTAEDMRTLLGGPPANAPMGTPELNKAGNVGGINNLAMARQQQALSGLGKPRPQGMPQGMPQGRPQGRPQGMPQGMPQGRPQGISRLPTNMAAMQNMARGGIVSFSGEDGESQVKLPTVNEQYQEQIDATNKLSPTYVPSAEEIVAADLREASKQKPEAERTEGKFGYESTTFAEAQANADSRMGVDSEGKESKFEADPTAGDIFKKGNERFSEKLYGDPSKGVYGDKDNPESTPENKGQPVAPGFLGTYKQKRDTRNKEIDEVLAKRKMNFLGMEIDPEMLSAISKGMAGKKSFAEGVSGGGVAATLFNKEQKQLEISLREKAQKQDDADLARELELAKLEHGNNSAQVKELMQYRLDADKFGFAIADAKNKSLEFLLSLDVKKLEFAEIQDKNLFDKELAVIVTNLEAIKGQALSKEEVGKRITSAMNAMATLARNISDPTTLNSIANITQVLLGDLARGLDEISAPGAIEKTLPKEE